MFCKQIKRTRQTRPRPRPPPNSQKIPFFNKRSLKETQVYFSATSFMLGHSLNGLRLTGRIDHADVLDCLTATTTAAPC